MRPMFVTAISLLLATVSSSQQRYLVSPNDEVIPLRRGEQASDVIEKRIQKPTATDAATCPQQQTFGYYSGYDRAIIGGRHKDVLAQWYVAKATGTIDTIFWRMAYNNALDSIVYLRVMESKIGPDFGPGARPGPYDPPCQQWGYWTSASDFDRGIAPFVDMATDTTWISTYNGPIPSVSPFGPPLMTPDLPVVPSPSGYTAVALSDFSQTLHVQTGDKFFIAFRINGPAYHPWPLDNYTGFGAAAFHVDPSDENYPSRLWKFYEHDSGPANCAGIPQNLAKRGWVARGGVGNDSLEVLALNLWYSMTLTSNTPPYVAEVQALPNTFDTGPLCLTTTVIDCNPANPAGAGVQSCILKWWRNGVQQVDITFAHVGGDNYRACLPPNPPGSLISYQVTACDSSAACSSSPVYSFRIVPSLRDGFYLADTGSSCVPKSIRATGTMLDTSDFYLPPLSPGTAAAGNDGTAGPIDMGSDMLLYGNGKRYAWVGVNGAIALSNNPTDTVDVNSSGAYTATWDFPNSQVRNGERSDITGSGAMPANFLAPLWADLTLTAEQWWGIPGTCGSIRYQNGYAGDTCLFIVEWDSIGAFAPLGGSACDLTTFRVALNKCDGTIEYQYDNVGLLGLDSTALVGLQGDSSSPFVSTFTFLNRNAYPSETKPRNNWCVKFYPSATTTTTINGWNMVSLGVIPHDSNYLVSNLYPCALSAFKFEGGYVSLCDVNTCLMEPGYGYWIKSAGICPGPRGSLIRELTVPVNQGWNIVPSIGTPIPTASVGVTGGVVLSNYFKYTSSGYTITTTLLPGHAQWVKMSGAGSLSLRSTSAVPKQASVTDLAGLSRLTIIDAAGRSQALYIGEDSQVKEQLSTYELPPQAPEFDARFASGRMVETFSADEARGTERPIQIEANAYPITIEWNIREADQSKFVLTGEGIGRRRIDGSGSMKLSNPDVKRISIIVSDEFNIPTTFALFQNYPNPFNPSTIIRYELPVDVKVTLKLYNVMGQEVQTLINQAMEAGGHSVEFSNSGLSSGVYFYTLTAGSFNETRKLLLVR